MKRWICVGVLLGLGLGSAALAEDNAFRQTSVWGESPEGASKRRAALVAECTTAMLSELEETREVIATDQRRAAVLADSSDRDDGRQTVLVIDLLRKTVLRAVLLAETNANRVRLHRSRFDEAVFVATSKELAAIGLEAGIVRTLEHDREVLSVCEVAPGRLLVLRGDHRLVLWDWPTQKIVNPDPFGEEHVDAIAALPSTTRVAMLAHGRLVIRDLAKEDPFDPVATDHSDRIFKPPIAVTPAGERILVPDDRGIIHVFDGKAEEIASLHGHSQPVRAIAVSEDSRRAVSRAADGTTRLWDLTTGGALTAPDAHEGAVTAFALSTDGERVLTGGADYTVRLWDVKTGRHLRCLQGHDRRIVAVALSPDGRKAASTDGSERAILWDLETGRAERTIENQRIRAVQFTERNELIAHTAEVASVAPLPSGRSVGGAIHGLEVRAADGTLEKQLPGTHFAAVTVTPDGRRALANDERHQLQVWDLEKGSLVKALENTSDSWPPLALSAAGELALTGHTKGVALWLVEGGWVSELIELHDPATALAWLSKSSFLVGTRSGRVLRYDR